MSRSRAPVLLTRLLSSTLSTTSIGGAAQLAALSNAFIASAPLRQALPSLISQLQAHRRRNGLLPPPPPPPPIATVLSHRSPVWPRCEHASTA